MNNEIINNLSEVYKYEFANNRYSLMYEQRHTEAKFT